MIICDLYVVILYLTVNSFSSKVKVLKDKYYEKKQLISVKNCHTI